MWLFLDSFRKSNLLREGHRGLFHLLQGAQGSELGPADNDLDTCTERSGTDPH